MRFLKSRHQVIQRDVNEVRFITSQYLSQDETDDPSTKVDIPSTKRKRKSYYS